MNTTLSWDSGVGMIYPSVESRWAISWAKYPASRSCVMSFSVTEEAIHLPCAPDPDMFGVLSRAGKARAWALELKNGWAVKGEGVGGWGRILIPLKGPRMLNASPLALKLAYSQWLCKRHDWVTRARIDEDPAIRGHDLCFDRTCQ